MSIVTKPKPALELGCLITAAKQRGLALHRAKAGRISAQKQEYATAKDAMTAFLLATGPGWLQTVESPDIRATQPDGRFADQADWRDQECPLVGERVSVNGDTSIHLMTAEATGGWTLVTLTTEPSVDSGLLLEQHFLGRADVGKLCYQVGWTPVLVGPAPHAHRELRPTAYRFLGFKT